VEQQGVATLKIVFHAFFNSWNKPQKRGTQVRCAFNKEKALVEHPKNSLI